jgi:hypothetical protein
MSDEDIDRCVAVMKQRALAMPLIKSACPLRSSEVSIGRPGSARARADGQYS